MEKDHTHTPPKDPRLGSETPAHKKPGVMARFLKWISRGSDQAQKNGVFCPT